MGFNLLYAQIKSSNFHYFFVMCHPHLTNSLVKIHLIVLPSVHVGLNHFTTPCLRDCTMLMLASGINAL